MGTSKEWKERRDAALPERKRIAKRLLAKAGITILEETQHSFIVKVNCARIEYFPYTGGFRGESIPPGSRGIHNLIALKK